MLSTYYTKSYHREVHLSSSSPALHVVGTSLEIAQCEYRVSRRGGKNDILFHAIRSCSQKSTWSSTSEAGRRELSSRPHEARAATSLGVDSLSKEVRQKFISGWICCCNNSLAEHRAVNVLKALHCLSFSRWQERREAGLRSSLPCCHTAPLW